MNIGVVGLGLIGGSLAKAIKAGTSHTVLGLDISEPVVCKAKLLEAIDAKLTEENLPGCEILILALYPRDTLTYLRQNAARIAKNAIVVDCCGVKRAVCEEAWKIAEQHGFTFIGGHPMEGAAKIGFNHSESGMFKNATMIFSPYKDVDIETMKKLKDVFDAIGFTRYEIASPEKHDRIIGYTSQLAHVLSNAYVKLPEAEEHKGFSAGSFRDMTRVSYLNEVMWAELFMENRENLERDIDQLILELQKYRDAIGAGDEARLRQLLKEGRECKERIDGSEGRI
jgi:prephenate dehydrogenase